MDPAGTLVQSPCVAPRANVTETALSTEPLLVSVIDDDNALRESLAELLQELGFSTTTFPSAEAFLASDSLLRARCLVLDVSMPGMSGPELFAELEARELRVPVVFITAHDEARARLLRTRGRDCLLKPFTDDALESALRRALGP
jgi:FixJ family two-component response regulator